MIDLIDIFTGFTWKYASQPLITFLKNPVHTINELINSGIVSIA